jgi:pimeloyl-ACP methyl ester carboxylesterase
MYREITPRQTPPLRRGPDWRLHAERAVDGHPLRLYRESAAHPQAPAAVLIHGMEEGWDIWTGAVRQLRDAFRPFALDLPWNGRSGNRWGRVQSPAAWLHQGLDLLPAPPSVLIAHSFGATAALEYLERHTPPVDAAVLVSPFYRAHDSELDWSAFTYYVDHFRRFLEHGLTVRMRPDLQSPAARATLTDMAEHVRRRIGPAGWMEFFALFSRTPSLRLDRLQFPVLVVGGGKDFAALPADCAELARALPAGHLELIPECGHFSMVEQPEAFQRLVGRFLARWRAGTARAARAAPRAIPAPYPVSAEGAKLR